MEPNLFCALRVELHITVSYLKSDHDRRPSVWEPAENSAGCSNADRPAQCTKYPEACFASARRERMLKRLRTNFVRGQKGDLIRTKRDG